MKTAKVTISSLLLVLSSHQSQGFTCVPRDCNPRTDNNCVCLSPQQQHHHPSSTARWSPRQRLGPVQARISGLSFDKDNNGADEVVSSAEPKKRITGSSFDDDKNGADEVILSSAELKKRLANVKESDDSLQLETIPTEEQEYKAKLAEAEKAIAEAEAARQKLLAKNDNNDKGADLDFADKANKVSIPPFGCQSTITRTDAGSLIIDIPSSGMRSDSMFAGFFSLAWFSAIIPATLSGGLAMSLFMLPFWASGGLVAKLAFYDPFLGGQLTIGQYAWSLKGTWLGLKKKEKDGATDDLRGAVAAVAAYVNGVPQAELRLYGSKGMVSLGLGLPLDELEYLAREINQYLLGIRKGGGSDKDMLYEGQL